MKAIDPLMGSADVSWQVCHELCADEAAVSWLLPDVCSVACAAMQASVSQWPTIWRSQRARLLYQRKADPTAKVVRILLDDEAIKSIS